MSTTTTPLTGADFDTMVDSGAFDKLGPRKIELIHGELRLMNPAGPIHDDHIDFLNEWSVIRASNPPEKVATIRVQAGFVCDDNRPEPDVLWLKPRRYGRTRPTAADVLLLIEVSDSSLRGDLSEKADIYAQAGIAEYWVVDIPNRRIHVMNDSENGCYRSIEIITPPTQIAPRCHPAAKLNTEKLFEVT